METTIIALAIALAAMVLIAVFAVAYCYKLQEKYNQLQKAYNESIKDLDIVERHLSAKIKSLEYNLLDNQNLLAKKDEEITHLNECISEYKKEILQYKNQIDELQKDNTLLGQQLADCQFKDKENRL